MQKNFNSIQDFEILIFNVINFTFAFVKLFMETEAKVF